MSSKDIQKKETAALPATLQAELDKEYDEMIKEGGFTLPQAKIVHESQRFEMPDGSAPKDFCGILLGEQRFNIYWDKEKDNGDESRPPDCIAMDARNGSVYGKCSECQFNKFGSGKDGEGKACANKSALLIWPTEIESALPYVVTISPSSLEGRTDRSRAGSKIATFGAPQRIPEVGIVARFKLEKATRGAQVFSKLDAEIVGTYKDGTISPEAVAEAIKIRNKFKAQLSERAEELETTVVEPQTGDGEDVIETEAQDMPDWAKNTVKPEEVKGGGGDDLPF